MTDPSDTRTHAMPATPPRYAQFIQKLLADELHDTVCQSLAGTSFLVKFLVRQSEAGIPIDTDDLRKTAKFLDRAMNDVRAIAANSESLAERKFAPALEQFARTISEDVPCRIIEPSDTRCDPEWAVVLYGLIRWTVRRVMSSSSSISLEPTETNGQFSVRINATFTGLTESEKSFLEQSADAAGIVVAFESAGDSLRFSVPALSKT